MRCAASWWGRRFACPGMALGVLLLPALAAAADTRLADAAMNGDLSAVRSLVQQKADVNGAQGDGSTALHWAAFRDDREMVKVLLAAGANAKAATREGCLLYTSDAADE